MPYSLLASIKESFSDELIKNAATSLKESPNKIRKAIMAAVPIILNCVWSKLRDTHENTEVLFMAKKIAASWTIENVRYHISDGDKENLEQGNFVLNYILENKISKITEVVSSYARIKQTSALVILNIATYISFQKIGKYAAKHNLNADDLKKWICGRRNVLITTLPYDADSISAILGVNYPEIIFQTSTGKESNKHKFRIAKIKYKLKKLFPFVFLGVLAIVSICLQMEY